jgi:hypothetical protein
VCLLLATAVAVYAQRTLTADQLVAFVRSSIQLHHDDQKVAAYIRKMKLSDKLEERKVEELRGIGAGPRTAAALRELSASSASLTVTIPAPPPPPKPVIPPPDSVAQARILNDIIENARSYSKSLPDYMCVQVTRRHVDPSGTENWRLYDTVQEQVNYVDHKESYKVVMVNCRSVANVDHLKMGGSTLSGDFGTIFTEIFAPESATEFAWDHWATLRGRRMYVFAFHVPQSRSGFTIFASEAGRVITAGYHGLLYADRDSNMVMRYWMDCDDIPSDYPIKEVKLDVNYDFVEIAGQKYVLPLKTELKSRERKSMTWNEAEFHLYRKFGADTTITFETPDPIPDEKTQEQPATPDAKDTKPPPVKKQPQ